MKSIILTYAPVKDSEKSILSKTDIYKIAINQHGSEYNPNARIITDYVLLNMCRKFPEKIISVREHLRCPSGRVEYFDTEFKGATIISAIEYLISQKYDEILIVGDNSVDSVEFQNLVNDEVDKLSKKVNIFQYSNGNFNLPTKTITDFCK